MRVVRVDEVKRMVEVVPETTLDLLNLFRLVQPGDVLYSFTTREMKKERADGSYDSERMRVRVAVEVEKKSLEPMMRRVSFLGRIIYESRDAGLEGKYHSIHLTRGQSLTIESRRGFQRLRGFADYYRRSQEAGAGVILVLVDDEGLAVTRIDRTGLRKLYEKRLPASGKEDPSARLEMVTRLYSGSAEVVRKEIERSEEKPEVLVFGPSVFVAEYLDYLRRHKREILGFVKRSGDATAGAAGVEELLRGGMLREYASRLKVVSDAEAVERLLETMARNPSMVALGVEECLRAVELGAVEMLLVSEDFLWEHLIEENVERLLELAEATRAYVRVVSSGLEASDKLNALGGVAAVLRYSLSPRGG